MDERELERRKRRAQKRRKRRLLRKIIRILIIVIIIGLLIGLGFLIKGLLNKEEEEPENNDVPVVDQNIEIEIPDPVTATILSGGDVILHSPFLSSNKFLQADGTYNFHDIFRFIKKIHVFKLLCFL